MQRTAKLLLVLFSGALIYTLFFAVKPERTLFANDQALSFAVVDALLSGEPVLAGPPSHTGGRHIGPFFYWIVAIAQWIGGDVAGTVRLVTIFMLLGCLPLFIIVRRLLPEHLRTWGYIGVAATLVSGYMDTLATVWHPHLLLPLGAFLLLSTLNGVERGWSAAPQWLFWAALTAQTHLASVPLVVGIGIALVIFAVQNRAPYRFGFTQLLWIAALLISFLPALYYEIWYAPNIRSLFMVHGDAQAYQSAGLKETCVSALNFISGALWGGTIEQLMSHGRGILQLALLGIMAAVIMQRREIFSSAAIRLALSSCAGIALTAVVLRGFASPLYDYYWSALLPLPPLFVAVFLAAAADASAARFGGRYVSAAIAALYLLNASWASVRHAFRFSSQPYVAYHSIEHAQQLTALLKRDAGTEPVEIFSRLHSKAMSNAYYYFLGPEYFDHMEVAWKFRELSRAPQSEFSEGSSAAQRAYMVICPRPFYKTRRALTDSMRSRWNVLSDLDTHECLSCEKCQVIRLTRIKRRDSTHHKRVSKSKSLTQSLEHTM